MSVVGNERALLAGCELFQRDQLAVQKRLEIRTVQTHQVRRVLEQHEGGETSQRVDAIMISRKRKYVTVTIVAAMVELH
ncbi:MAG TPA: hypothetical protein VF534_32565 [Paraburkholderia sp.]